MKHITWQKHLTCSKNTSNWKYDIWFFWVKGEPKDRPMLCFITKPVPLSCSASVDRYITQNYVDFFDDSNLLYELESNNWQKSFNLFVFLAPFDYISDLLYVKLFITHDESIYPPLGISTKTKHPSLDWQMSKLRCILSKK